MEIIWRKNEQREKWNNERKKRTAEERWRGGGSEEKSEELLARDKKQGKGRKAGNEKASIIDDKEWTLRSWRNREFSLPLSLLCHVGNVRGIKGNNDVKAFLSCVLQPQPYSLSPTANQRLSTPIPDSYVFTPSYLELFMS